MRTKHAFMPACMSALLVCLWSLCANAFANEQLLEAVKSEDAAAVRSLLSQGASPDALDTDGTSALAWAAHFDQLEIATALMQAGANVDATNRFGVGPLYLAAENGSAPMLEALLASGVNPNTALPDGETTLMTAARAGDASAIGVLLDAGADVNAVENAKGQTALMWAAAENNAEAVTKLIEAGADIGARPRSGEFDALAFAVRAGAMEAARALLDAGAEVNSEARAGTSMLVLAVMNAHYELAGMLLDYGADPNADDQGWTALHQIVWSRRWNRGFNLPGPSRTGNLSSLDLVSKLVAAGADVNARMHAEPNDGRRNVLNRIGATPFLLAAKTCDLPLMRLLLSHGADASITTEEGTTAIMVAAGVGIWAPGENPGTHEEALAAIKLAVEAGGGDVNAIDANGETAIHGAVYRGGAVAIIEYLAGLGARLDVVNKNGWSPLIAAEGIVRTGSGLKHYPEAADAISRLLRDRGFDPDGVAQQSSN